MTYRETDCIIPSDTFYINLHELTSLVVKIGCNAFDRFLYFKNADAKSQRMGNHCSDRFCFAHDCYCYNLQQYKFAR